MGPCWGVAAEICGGFWGADLVVFFLRNFSTLGRGISSIRAHLRLGLRFRGENVTYPGRNGVEMRALSSNGCAELEYLHGLEFGSIIVAHISCKRLVRHEINSHWLEKFPISEQPV